MNERAPVFQTKLGIDANQRVGWLLADEDGDSHDSFCSVVPWSAAASFGQQEFVLFSEVDGKLIDLMLHFDGQTFVNSDTGVRFGISDPMAPHDLRGLPPLHCLPYVGNAPEVLKEYRVDPTSVFFPVVPLAPILMDELPAKRLVFVGITRSFGPHRDGTAAEMVPGGEFAPRPSWKAP